jgi:hypothetical protein
VQASFANINHVKSSTPVERYTNTEDDTEQLVPEEKTKKG